MLEEEKKKKTTPGASCDNWIFDNDGGLDDTYALVLLLSQKKSLRLCCITVVAGNVVVEVAANATARTLEICKTKIPIYLGAQEGIIEPVDPIFGVHGFDGQGDALEYADLKGYTDCIHTEIHAAEAIVKFVNENPGNISVLATGPLTNLALAIKLDPSIVGKLKRCVIMGGAHHAMGNTSWTAEFNFSRDPEAANICISKIPFCEIVTVENGNNFELSPADQEAWHTTKTARGRFLNCITKRIMRRCGGTFCFDALAALVAIDKGFIETGFKANCQVEIHGSISRGALLIDWRHKEDLRSDKVMPTIAMSTKYEEAVKMLIQSTHSI